jgi:uridylate kinase
MTDSSAYRRILVKLSGEALMGDLEYGISSPVIGKIAAELIKVVESGVEVAVVIGGGNIFRGEGLARGGIQRVTADQMGMLATVMNALALQDAVEKQGSVSRVMSAVRINQVCEDYILRRAARHLEKGRIVILAAGTGNPFFTTDSAAALRAIELDAQLMIKATKVDGIYSADPKKDASARRYERLSYDEVLDRRLGVMDQTAIVLCRDHQLPLCVYDITQSGSLARIASGDTSVGTIVV